METIKTLGQNILGNKKENNTEEQQTKSNTQNETTLGNLLDNPETKDVEISVSESPSNNQIVNPSVEFNNMIDKIMNSDLPKEIKLKLLMKFKDEMINPGKGEQRKFNEIEQMYKIHNDINNKLANPYQQQLFSHMMQTPQQLSYYNPYYTQQPPNFQMTSYPQYYQQSQPTMAQQPIQGYQFEVLKNKLDTIQLEMVDMVRHLKDYSKKYMAAVREDDMTKLDSYVRDLINVDKKVEQAKEIVDEEVETRKEMAETAAEEEPQTLFGKATSGIKGMVSGLGKNVSSISDLVKNTAGATDSFLKKNILNNSDEKKEDKPNNKNIVNVEDYKLDEPETETTEPATAATEPETTEPVTAATETATPEPTTTEPANTEPATPEPATTETVTSEPATTETVTSEPATTETVTSEPATTETVTSEPATTEPATPEPATPATETATPEPATPATETATPEPATPEPTTPTKSLEEEVNTLNQNIKQEINKNLGLNQSGGGNKNIKLKKYKKSKKYNINKRSKKNNIKRTKKRFNNKKK
jgi:hypothetical protein